VFIYFKRTISARFGLIWFSGFKAKDLNVIFDQNMPNLHNRYKSAEINVKLFISMYLPLGQLQLNFGGMVLGWPPSKNVSDSPALHSRWLLLLKIEFFSVVHCCFIVSEQNIFM
jgi:hypothetical protein